MIVNDKSLVGTFSNNLLNISHEVQGNSIFKYIFFSPTGNHVEPELIEFHFTGYIFTGSLNTKCIDISPRITVT